MATTSSHDVRRMALLVVGLTALLGVLLVAFALPAAKSGAHHVPLGVAADASTAAQLKQQIESGSDAFTVTTYPDEDAARTAILERKVYGAVVIGPEGVQTLVATAAGASVAPLIQQFGSIVAASGGAQATVTDVRPFPEADPRGAGLAAGALPMALGGWIGAVVIMLVIPTTGRRVVTALAFSVVGGLGLTAVLEFVIGTLDGNFLITALGAMLGIAATAMAVLGLRTLLGGVGLGIAAVLLILLGNPLSGLTSAPELLPRPWGAIGQFLPPGATGSLLRDLAFFDGHGALRPGLVLLGWLLGGAVLLALGVARHRSTPDDAAGDTPDDSSDDAPDDSAPEHEIEKALGVTP